MYSKDKRAKRIFEYFKENNIAYYGFHMINKNKYQSDGFVDNKSKTFIFLFKQDGKDDQMTIKIKDW